MNASVWSDDQVNAFVDGQLDAPEALRLKAALVQDAVLAARVEQQRALRAQLAAAFDPVLDEPVPSHLIECLAPGGRVVPIGTAGHPLRAATPSPRWWFAAAASTVVALLIGWNLPRAGGGHAVAAGDLLASGTLHDALSNQFSDAGVSGGVQVMLSFRDIQGRWCRAFALADGVDGLACRDDVGWRIEATGRNASSDTPGADNYRQAATTLSAGVLAVISQQQASDVLAPEEERVERDSGWR